MKKVLLSLLFSLLVMAGYAQQAPDGVWGIPFGTSREQVKKMLKEKQGLSPVLEDDESLVYENCRFAEHDGSAVDLYFFEEKLYKGLVSIPPKTETKIVEEYQDILNSLSTKYGKPTKSMETYKDPYKKGDGHAIQAIESENADISAYWIFPAGRVENAKVSLLLRITKRKDFMLSYTDKELEDKANKALLNN